MNDENDIYLYGLKSIIKSQEKIINLLYVIIGVLGAILLKEYL